EAAAEEAAMRRQQQEEGRQRRLEALMQEPQMGRTEVLSMAWHELLDASICIANKNCGMEERSERRRRVEQREKELQEQEMEQ
ncbi:unnamed protein product, partial [Durusdinium trenchii]